MLPAAGPAGPPGGRGEPGTALPADAVIAVDVGTSAVRAATVGAEGSVLAFSRVERVSDGGRCFDAEALWDGVVEALATLDHCGRRPAAVALAAHLGTVPVDEQLQPVDEAGGWSDPRGLDQLRALPGELRQLLLRTGRRPTLTGGTLAYALTLQDRPYVRHRVAHLLSPKDFLTARLTGEVTTDHVHAAYTLLSDVAGDGWSSEAVSTVGLDPGWLPRQVAGDEIVGAVGRSAARDCRLPPGTPVVAGGPDGSVGLGLLLGTDTAAVADVAGTTDVVGRLLDDLRRAPRGAVVNPALVHGSWTAGGPTGMTGGAVARWRALTGAVTEEESARVPPGADGLVALPALTGSRFPHWQPADRGALLGLGPEHTAAHLLRAAQEGASFTVREAVDLLDPPTHPPAAGTADLPVVLAGGTARSGSAVQMRADVLRRTVLVCEQPDVTLLGTAALALVGIGLAADLDDARHRLGCAFREVRPDPERAERYDDLYAAWLTARSEVGDLRRATAAPP